MGTRLETLEKALREGLTGFDRQATQVHPAGDASRWSVQQIVEHLLMTYSATASNFEQRLAKGTTTEGRPTVGQRVGQFVVCTLGIFPKGRKSPAMVMPPAEPEPASGEELAARTTEVLRRLEGLSAEAEGRFGSRRAAMHPVLGPLSVDQWRRFHLAHGLHHLRQIAALREGGGR